MSTLHPLLAGLDPREVDPGRDPPADTEFGGLGRLAASGPRAAAVAGVLVPSHRRAGVRLRAHRLESAVVAVVAGWALVGLLTLAGWH